MQLSDAIAGRRTVREYTTQAVDQTIVRGLIDAAVLAPSAVNQQPYMFTVVRNQTVLDRISRAAKSHMLETLGANPHAEQFRMRLSDPTFQIFYQAPALILISAIAEGPWIVEDCALAAENLMLAAFGAGLGSGWIGFAQGYLNTPEGKQQLELPAACVPIAPIIVGYPKTMPPPVPRKTPEINWIG